MPTASHRIRLAPRRRRVSVEVLLVRQDPESPQTGGALSHEERSRASAISDHGERRRFYDGRRLLRAVLAERTGTEAADLQIASGPNGQAFLLGAGPFFSLAHNQQWHGLALCDGLSVGVALAPKAQQPSLDAVVSALLPAHARADIAAAPPADRADTTMRWWLTMEAAVRACGAGRDQAAECLSRVTAEVACPTPEIMVAVAACTERGLDVRWSVLNAAARV